MNEGANLCFLAHGRRKECKFAPRFTQESQIPSLLMSSQLTSSARGLPGAGRVIPQQDLLALVGGRLRRGLLLPVLHDVRERQLFVRVQGLTGRIENVQM